MSDPPATILVVDDERSVLDLVSMMLQRGGYTVLVANGGKEALALLESRADIALTLVDCNMPEMSGPELDEMILARWPHIKVIAMSGRPRAPELRGDIAFIHKPFRSAALIGIIEGVLGRQAA